MVALGVLEGRWKATKTRGGGGGGGTGAVAAAGPADLLISVQFRGMGEWQDISRQLPATPGIEDLDVAGLSARGARVTLRYAGGAERSTDGPCTARALPCERGRQLGHLGTIGRSTGPQHDAAKIRRLIGVQRPRQKLQPAPAVGDRFGPGIQHSQLHHARTGHSVPVVFWLLMTGQTQVAFLVFICAGICDAVDGYLAKSFGWRTELGAYLDPLADKLLIVSIYIALGVDGKLPLWLVITVVRRDILIVVAVMLSWLLDQPVRIKPLAVSKANTVAQIVLAATVLADDGFGLGPADGSPGAGVDYGRFDAAFARCLSHSLADAHVRL